MMRYIVLGIFAATPFSVAFANDAGVEPSTPAADHSLIEGPNPLSSGYRISDTSEFQLVEHGHWEPQRRAEVTEKTTNTGDKDIRSNTLPQTKLKKRPTNFRRAAFLPHVYAAETRFGLPTGLLDALIWTESRYNPIAVSHAGAGGLGQLMPRTAKELGVANRFDPHANIIGAARYLRQMFDQFGQIHLALAAYNAGPRAVSRANGIPFNGETPAYVRNVLSFWQGN